MSGLQPTARPGLLALMASSAGIGFDLAERGTHDDSVDRELAEGESLCAFLAAGVAAESSTTFSARTIDARRAVELVRAVADGPRFVEDAGRIRDEIAAARAALRAGSAWTDAWEVLRDRLFRLSVQIMYAYAPLPGCRP
jgi:hypothetical protein